MKKILLTAKFCGPCHVLKNKIKREKIEIEIHEMEENMEIFQKYGVKTVPTLILENSDETFQRITGSDDIFKEIK